MVICRLHPGFRYSNTSHLKDQTSGQGQQCVSFVSSIHGSGTKIQINRKLQTGASDSNAGHLKAPNWDQGQQSRSRVSCT